MPIERYVRTVTVLTRAHIKILRLSAISPIPAVNDCSVSRMRPSIGPGWQVELAEGAMVGATNIRPIKFRGETRCDSVAIRRNGSPRGIVERWHCGDGVRTALAPIHKESIGCQQYGRNVVSSADWLPTRDLLPQSQVFNSALSSGGLEAHPGRVN